MSPLCQDHNKGQKSDPVSLHRTLNTIKHLSPLTDCPQIYKITHHMLLRKCGHVNGSDWVRGEVSGTVGRWEGAHRCLVPRRYCTSCRRCTWADWGRTRSSRSCPGSGAARWAPGSAAGPHTRQSCTVCLKTWLGETHKAVVTLILLRVHRTRCVT